MKSNLYIPKKIHVGFQKREGTYTGKLAYVIYEDEKGVLRKQTSWDGWRDKKIKEVVLDNEPTRFVFNKGVQRHGYFGSGRSVMRVYDNRDFEFEITIENLVGILMHSDISKRDILEDCVFAWAGKDLVLLPVNSEEYRASVEFTDKQSLKISTKDLVKGYLYEKKKSEGHLMYMGYEEFYDRNGYANEHKSYGKKHIFYDLEAKSFVVPSPSTIAKAVLEEVNENFANINDKLHKSYHLKEMQTFNVRNGKKANESYGNTSHYKKYNDVIIQISYSNYYNKDKIDPEQSWIYKNEIIKNGKTLTMKSSNLDYTNDKDFDLFKEIMQEIGLDWKVVEDKSYYYNRKKIKGTIYSKSAFEEKVKMAGFGNIVTVVDTDEKTTDWK